MAFTVHAVRQTVFGDRRVVGGFYENDAGSTGGVINTGLDRCEIMTLQPIAAAVTAAHVISTATAPYSPDPIIITGANEGGFFMAYGL